MRLRKVIMGVAVATTSLGLSVLSVPTAGAAGSQYFSYVSGGGLSVPDTSTLTATLAANDSNFVQLAPGDAIVMSLPAGEVAMPDGTPAPDITVWNFDLPYPAYATISVSMDGVTWTQIPNPDSTDPLVTNGSWPDTAPVGIDLDSYGPARFVKVDQGTNYIDPAYPTLGFDLNAVEALQTATMWTGGNHSMGWYKQHPFTTSQVACTQVSVDSSSSTPVTVPAANGVTYSITASGTYVYDGSQPAGTREADAEFSHTVAAGFPSDWADPAQYAEPLLDLTVNGSDVTWGATPDTTTHRYTISQVASGGQFSFVVNDNYYPDNTGTLTVKVCRTYSASSINTAISNFSKSPWNKFLAQFGISLANVAANPALANATYYDHPGDPFDFMTVSQLITLGSTYTSSTPSAQLLSLMEVFDDINNNMNLYTI